MKEEVKLTQKEETTPEQKEQIRLVTELLKNRDSMVAEYRALIKHSGGLLTNSMVFAYSKGINDTIKLASKPKEIK